ncbi:protein FAM107B [Asbolus verrucosus]|uniref:Protein FAM107B n=1 Tax=Asbolus verrucosus TaxID=1661398 RepID=A0A482VTJ5_ASBVE|nr:protein FAM107B [Asbolus verrucosus]
MPSKHSTSDLTTKEEQPIKTQNTIEELKSKLSNKETEDCAAMIPEGQRGHHPPPPLLTEDGLIIPRKPANPVKENSERQNLHKELMFNQKIGKNVLNQKSELQRALEKQKENRAKKEMENHLATKTPELEKAIADRAKRLQANTNDEKNEDDKVINKEFLQARMKLKNRSDSK